LFLKTGWVVLNAFGIKKVLLDSIIDSLYSSNHRSLDQMIIAMGDFIN